MLGKRRIRTPIHRERLLKFLKIRLSKIQKSANTYTYVTPQTHICYEQDESVLSYTGTVFKIFGNFLNLKLIKVRIRIVYIYNVTDPYMLQKRRIRTPIHRHR